MIGIIIQARTGSTRLPDKMILPFFDNMGILETILTRLKNANLQVPIIVATTKKSSDDIIEEIGAKQNIEVFRGSENDVLKRYINTAEKYGFEKIIRICADNPFLDMTALDHQIKVFNIINVDYWCYSLKNKTPTIKTHYGFWTEGVKLSALNKVAEKTEDKHYREHVTNYIYSNPQQFSIHFQSIDRGIEIEKNIRLTIDTEQDFELGKKIFQQLIQLKIPLTAQDITSFLQNKPDYNEIMKNEINKNLK
jgi:spore coat polysaccharide biosynthesis protein SpsF (cytidylyltransferase family)